LPEARELTPALGFALQVLLPLLPPVEQGQHPSYNHQQQMRLEPCRPLDTPWNFEIHSQ
jgi:hypothetical protein